MIVSLRHFLGWLVSSFSCRADLVLENLALRRQLLALHAQRPRRRLTALHKLFWIALRMWWSGWRQALVLVTPRTVVNWHRAGFRLYWRWVSRISQVGGRKRVSKEVRDFPPVLYIYMRAHVHSGSCLFLAKTLGVLSFTPLTMLRACAQAVDFKAGHHFGEGQGFAISTCNSLGCRSSRRL
jgi:hypothetical protein